MLKMIEFFVYFCFFFLFSFFFNTFASPIHHHLCRLDQKNALLNFKNEFQILTVEISCLPPYDPTHDDIPPPILYPKTDSWKNNSDCCFWNGVICDSKLGVVIGLDLSCNGFYGSFKPNSSLFKLTHLQRLNLAYNDFNQSSIPSDLSKLTQLTLLNLSSSGFLSRIPNELLQLTNLVSLDLSGGFTNSLSTETSFLSKLTRNLTNLRELQLSSTDIFSEIPKEFANLTSLRSLFLVGCNLMGEFPSSVFLLPHIESIGLSGNLNLSGSLPESFTNSSLKYLNLFSTLFSGNLPDSISNLKSLQVLSLKSANFSRNLPASIGNLSSLTVLDLSDNNFAGEVPSSINNLNKLNVLSLSGNKFTGSLSLGLRNFPELNYLDLSGNQFTVLLPTDNGINIPNANSNMTSYLPSHLGYLDLSTCNITEIPGFIQIQQELSYLDLSFNKIQGQLPKWLWKLPMLSSLNLSHNSFDSFQGSPKILSAKNLNLLDLSSNEFQGSFPLPPMSTTNLFASANNFTGNIPQGICKLKSLETLDLSSNSFNGLIPPCFGDLLLFVSLRSNNLSGSIPDTFISCQTLQALDVGHNKLTGKLPRSLLNCMNLEVLDVEHNQIKDKFPVWLEDLQPLKVLIIRSNRFHGPMVFSRFHNLQILDISHNNFSGTLPLDCFVNRTAMSRKDDYFLGYLGSSFPYYGLSLVITNKGTEMKFEKILTVFKAVDFSGNRFQGQIPESIGLLRGLIVLNLSNNIFTGHIPQSLANLTELESLDFSQNKLSGRIPSELGDLTRLERINFSHNQLTGAIPQGPQFVTQDSSSFAGNLRLCGRPLEETCDTKRSPAQLNPQPEPQEEVLSWIAMVIGYIPGLVFGLTIGHIVVSYKQEWFLKVLGLNVRRRNRNR